MLDHTFFFFFHPFRKVCSFTPSDKKFSVPWPTLKIILLITIVTLLPVTTNHNCFTILSKCYIIFFFFFLLKFNINLFTCSHCPISGPATTCYLYLLLCMMLLYLYQEIYNSTSSIVHKLCLGMCLTLVKTLVGSGSSKHLAIRQVFHAIPTVG